MNNADKSNNKTMNTEFKGTLGKIESVYTKLSDFTLCTVITEKRVIAHINSQDVTSEESKANAELFADAGNTIQSCGLLPSELLKQRDEMIALLKEVKVDIDLSNDITDSSYKKLLDILKSTEGKAV